MRTSFLLALSLCIFSNSSAQVFFQESFESQAGWSLSHSFDDGNDDYCKRDSAIALDELGFTLFGWDGDFVIALEDTDGLTGEAPEDGIVTLTLDPVDISGVSDLELVVELACNSIDEPFDDRTQDNGDYLDVQVNIDGAGWNTIAQFNSRAGGSSISTLYYDVDMDGDGGELGELTVNNAMTDYVLPVSQVGSTAEIRLIIKMDGADESVVIDNIRLKESEGDVTPPTIYSAEVVDANTLEIVFNEPLGSNAEQVFNYLGISGLSSATLLPDDHTVVLDYSSDFDLGEPYLLTIVSVQDQAGNAMSGAYGFPFYWNPTTPELVITELMYNDPSAEDTLEFIEIYNFGSDPAIVGGFRLEEAVEHTLASVTIPPNGFYLVARNAEAAENFYALSFEDYGGQLSNNSEHIRLVNVDGVILDSLTYNDNVPWPSAGDGFGPSIELVSPELENSMGSNWVASDNGLGVINGLPLFATPGTLPGATLPVVELDNNDVWVNEQDGVIELDFYIAGANSNQSVVNVTMIEGDATSPEDHGANTISTLQLPANSNGLESIAFPLVNDSDLEGVEYFTLEITANSNCQIGLNDRITIVIADDEYQSPGVVINEIQSSNASIIEDEAGEFEDWFELYNPNDVELDVAGYFVSDDPLDLLKDRLPVGDASTIIPPFGFLVIWADENGSQGPLHVNFKLSADGESISLTEPDGSTAVDMIDFGPLLTDNSLGRFCDGEDIWTGFMDPTPGSENCANSLSEHSHALSLYPNPADEILYLPRTGSYEVFDAQGRRILSGTASQIPLEDLQEGVYYLRFDNLYSAPFIKVR
jgi:hypothetical protein